jgi:hypothetical protein
MDYLVNDQSAFLRDVAKLIEFADQQGFEVTGGELFRTREQQQLYYKSGKALTMNSQHARRLAIDLFFFKREPENKLRVTYANDELKVFGDYWESLDPKNRWGGNFKRINDTVHFERRE